MRRFLALALATSLSAGASAQAWQKFYEEGLSNARQGHWADARNSFLRAVEARPNDSSKPTPLFGAITERRQWRDGAPYSANFLAAYSGFRASEELSGDPQKALLEKIANELEALIDRKQAGQVAALTLVETYNRLGDVQRRARLQQRAGVPDANWREDLEIVQPEAQSTTFIATPTGVVPVPVPTNPPVKSNPPVQQGGTTPPTIPPIAPPPTNPVPNGTGLVPPIAGGVALIANKFALIIGNGESRLPDGKIDFAQDDAVDIREAIQNYAGYPRENVETVLNGTADQIKTAAAALAARMPDGASVLVYYTGNGTNIAGKDYLAGVDTELPTDIGSMVAKEDLYRYFFIKGASVFAFFQTNRPMVNNRCFGTELPVTGAISQMQATMPGEGIKFIYQNQRPVGIFTDAFVRALEKFKTNQVPISEFGWEVFYSMRRRDSGSSGGSSLQTPTVPTRIGLASDAKF